jgi:hypothetical protein
MPVVPLAIMAGGAIISHYAAKSAAAAAAKRSPEELTAQGGAQTGAAKLQTAGSAALDTGAETQRPATTYYDTLLHGNRAQMSQAVAAPTAKITDVYAGATRNLEQSGVRGAQKDVASADLAKNRASAISGLVTGVQPVAANALTSIGETQQARGASMVASGNNTYSNLLGIGQANRVQSNKAGTDAAASVGALATSAAGVYTDWYKGRQATAGG